MKKFLAVLLTMVLAFALTAVADETPSKTVEDMARVLEVQSTDGAEGDGIAIVVDDQIEEYAPVAEQRQQIAAIVSEGKAPATYFPEAVQEAVAAKLPAGVDSAALQFNEVVAVKIEGQTTAQPVDMWVDLMTPYQPDQTIVAVLGLYDGTKDADGEYNVEWIVLDAEVRQYSDGEWYPVVSFTAEAVEKVAAASFASIFFLNSEA